MTDCRVCLLIFPSMVVVVLSILFDFFCFCSSFFMEPKSWYLLLPLLLPLTFSSAVTEFCRTWVTLAVPLSKLTEPYLFVRYSLSLSLTLCALLLPSVDHCALHCYWTIGGYNHCYCPHHLCSFC